MSKLEDLSAKRERWSKTKEAVLVVVGTGAVLSVGLVAPRVLSLLKSTATGRKLANKLYRTKSVFSEMIKDGYIALDNLRRPRLTTKGQTRLRMLHLGQAKYKKPKRWDGKWRILMFDIKEPRRTVRERLRSMLTRIGFVKLQNSVWVYPYDCEELILLLKTDFKLGREVLYVIADQIENDTWLKEHFSLLRR